MLLYQGFHQTAAVATKRGITKNKHAIICYVAKPALATGVQTGMRRCWGVGGRGGRIKGGEGGRGG